MSNDRADYHLSQISTVWTLVREAHQTEHAAVSAAQQLLMERYSGAVYRYLMGALRDPHAADEVFQEFALRFIRGDFRRADPDRGRFRQFVKTSLFNLIVDYQKRQKKRAASLDSSFEQPATYDEEYTGSDEAFTRSCRDDFLDRAWRSLAQVQTDSGQPYYDLLRLRAEKADLKSAALAELLSKQLGKPISADATRQLLHRARDRFAELLCDEVRHSLESPDEDDLEQELIELGLYAYCRPVLERRAGMKR